MEALGAAASIVGIVSLGIQIGQILQKQIDDVQYADLRLLQIASEIWATARSLQNLQALLLEDEENQSERIFSHQSYQDIIAILNRCNVVFFEILLSLWLNQGLECSLMLLISNGRSTTLAVEPEIGNLSLKLSCLILNI